MTRPPAQTRPARPARRRRWRILLVIVAVMMASAVWAREPLLQRAAWALTVDNADVAGDYLVVLGGAAEIRPFTAADLYRRKLAPRVLIFEYDRRRVTAGNLPQTELNRRILQLEGVPADAIVEAPGFVRTSWDEAQSLRRFLRAHGGRRVIVVTSAEHSRRANWTFRKALRGLGVDVRMAPARHLEFDETNWWKNDEGVLLYLHEYLKLPFNMIRHARARNE